MVHTNAQATEYAVVAIYFDVDEAGNTPNDFISSLQLSKINGQVTAPLVPLKSLVKVLNSKKLIHYSGSLTSPPCTEAVQWIIIHDPQPISEA